MITIIIIIIIILLLKGGSVFRECSFLTQIFLTNGLSVLGAGMFAYTGLVKLNIPSTITSVGEYDNNNNSTNNNNNYYLYLWYYYYYYFVIIIFIN